MSLNVGPVCASCGRISGVSISCTKCFQVCCPSCFNDLVNVLVQSAMSAKIDMATLTERICRKCNVNCPADNSEQEIATGSPAARNLCPLHGKVCKLFCSNCSESICGACIDQGEQHDSHRVDSLETVYRARSSQVEAKLTQATKLNDEQHAEAATYGKNLELLEKEEDIVLKEIEAMVQSSKLQVSQATTDRKEILREKLKVPVANKAVLTDLRNKLEQLSKTEFLQQASEIDKRCDELIGCKNVVGVLNTDDIYCDLIPSYQFQRIVYTGFWNAENDDSHVVSLETTYDFEWKFTLRKSSKIQVQSIASDPEIVRFRHMLVVIIPHPDYSKSIHQVFDLMGPNNTFDAVETSYLKENGFGNTNGDLLMMIGVRPLNLLIEKRLLSHQIVKLSSKPEKFDRDHLIMHFNPKLSDLQDNVTLYSLQIQDEMDQEWRLKITLKSNLVGAHVQLFKLAAAGANYFIELKHTNPEETIVKTSTANRLFTFERGFKKFVAWDTLIENDGFYPDGILHFRFGVRPIESISCKNKTLCAANA